MTTINPDLRAAAAAQLSARHARWGENCPATDIDFLLLEYDRASARALVEYKYWANTRRIDAETPSMRAAASLATDAGRPFFGARYCTDTWSFRAYALNDLARPFLPTAKTLTEKDWVALLYEVRGRSLPPHLGALLKDDFKEEGEENAPPTSPIIVPSSLEHPSLTLTKKSVL